MTTSSTSDSIGVPGTAASGGIKGNEALASDSAGSFGENHGDRTGIVECEIFAAAYRSYSLNTVRYPVVQIAGEVKHFDNFAGYTLEVLRVEKARNG